MFHHFSEKIPSTNHNPFYMSLQNLIWVGLFTFTSDSISLFGSEMKEIDVNQILASISSASPLSTRSFMTRTALVVPSVGRASWTKSLRLTKNVQEVWSVPSHTAEYFSLEGGRGQFWDRELEVNNCHIYWTQVYSCFTDKLLKLIFKIYLFFRGYSTYCALAQIPLDARWMFSSVSESSFFKCCTSWLKRAGVVGLTSWLVSRHNSRRVFWASRLDVSSSSILSTCWNVNDLRDEIVSVTVHNFFSSQVSEFWSFFG